MPAPVSLDLRLRIVRAVERGSPICEAARRLAVSSSTAIKLMRRVRTTGSPRALALRRAPRRDRDPHQHGKRYGRGPLDQGLVATVPHGQCGP